MGRGKDRGRGRGGRKQESDGDKSDGPKDDNVKCKRCGDVGHKAVRCPGQMCDEFFDQLRQRFPVKNLAELKMYTGCAFERDWDNGILEINQTAFAINMVEQYNISTTSNIPGSPGVDLGPRKYGEPGGDEKFPEYRALVGSLMSLSVMTRPDIANALRACSRQSHNPSPRHWKAFLQVASYVNATKEIGLRFARGSGLRLSVYADADYAAASNERKVRVGCSGSSG